MNPRHAGDCQAVLTELRLLAEGRHSSQQTILERYRRCAEWKHASPDPCASALQQTRSATDCLLDRSSRLVAATCLIPVSRGYAVARLDGIRPSIRFTGGIDAAARLSLTIVSAGLVDTAYWAQAGRHPFAFIAQGLKDFVEAHGGEDLHKESFFQPGLVSDLDPYAGDGNETGLQEDMYIILEPDSAGYMVLEPTLRLLVRTHPRLPISSLICSKEL